MDISTIVAEARTIEIKHPVTGEPIGLRVTLRPDSADEVQAVKRKLVNERLRRDLKPSAERIEENGYLLLDASISGWEWDGDLTFEGSKPELSPKNLRKVLKRLTWMRDQIDTELGNDAAFFENSASA
jgi:hypothetical protein